MQPNPPHKTLASPLPLKSSIARSTSNNTLTPPPFSRRLLLPIENHAVSSTLSYHDIPPSSTHRHSPIPSPQGNHPSPPFSASTFDSFHNTNRHPPCPVTPTIPREAKLDDLGNLYVSSGTKCTRERASFVIRLLHFALDGIIEELYIASEEQRRTGLKDGSVKIPPLGPDDDRGCACCRGDPDAVILSCFHEENALYFWEEDYKATWGDEPNVGGMYGSKFTWLKASKQQVEREAAKQEEIASKL
ncbi:hypothetical protein BJX65DRAFT_275030 [Aspergillus insuetus]